MRAELRVSDDPAGVAAELMSAVTGQLVLTGGSTPRQAYHVLAGLRSEWSDVELWFTDERCVAPDHEHSNHRMVDEALLSRIAGATVHRMKGELGPHEGADEYERQLGGVFGEELPAFDFMLLGLGPDAHTCSLFPGDDALAERERRAVGVETPGMAPLVPRITLTLPVVNAAKQAVFLVTGADKADAVARAFAGPPDPRAPASLVEGPVTLVCDAAAASGLDL
ncbi:MAG TPA: 6-phosphogluconolactonase [Thermoleophilaceae bacterium]|nr:6-phosphogluconolactonase [Thermoleophilaceae bacterium]